MTSTAITPAELRARLESDQPPIVIDVRGRAAFEDDDALLGGAIRRDPDDVRTWASSLPSASAVVVYSRHGHAVSPGVASALREVGIQASYLEGGLDEWKRAGNGLDAKPRGASTRWVTRERPKIDRIACPWLIARFVDPRAEFLYVPTRDVLDTAKARSAVPYDIPDVHFSHEGERCSFDAFVRHYRLTDPALRELAIIVRGADTDRLDLAPQAAGLAAISLGLSRNLPDDHEMLRHGMVMYDALYRWCKEGKDEIHTWNPGTYR